MKIFAIDFKITTKGKYNCFYTTTPKARNMRKAKKAARQEVADYIEQEWPGATAKVNSAYEMN